MMSAQHCNSTSAADLDPTAPIVALYGYMTMTRARWTHWRVTGSRYVCLPRSNREVLLHKATNCGVHSAGDLPRVHSAGHHPADVVFRGQLPCKAGTEAEGGGRRGTLYTALHNARPRASGWPNAQW